MGIDYNKYNELINTMNLNINPIPIDYSNKLTTTKWLMSISAILKDILESVEQQLTDSHSYTDEEIKKVMIALENNYDSLNALIINSIDYTDIEVSKLNDTILNVVSTFNNEISRLNLRNETVDSQIAELYRMFMNGTVYVYSPPTGLFVPVQQALNDLYDFITADDNHENFTAELYDTLDLSAESYELLSPSAIQYDINWKIIFF